MVGKRKKSASPPDSCSDPQPTDDQLTEKKKERPRKRKRRLRSEWGFSLRKRANKKAKKSLNSKKKLDVYHVPRSKVDRIMEKLTATNEPYKMWNSIINYCHRRLIDRFIDPNELHHRVNDLSPTRLLIEARTCLLYKDWRNLAAILSILFRGHSISLRPIVKRYALILLLNDPLIKGTDHLNRYLDITVGITTETGIDEYLKQLHNYPDNFKYCVGCSRGNCSGYKPDTTVFVRNVEASGSSHIAGIKLERPSSSECSESDNTRTLRSNVVKQEWYPPTTDSDSADFEWDQFYRNKLNELRARYKGK